MDLRDDEKKQRLQGDKTAQTRLIQRLVGHNADRASVHAGEANNEILSVVWLDLEEDLLVDNLEIIGQGRNHCMDLYFTLLMISFMS